MPDEPALTEREAEILRLVATGASNKEIALTLRISPNTVKVHLRNIFEKISVASRTEATLYALRMLEGHGLNLAESQPERLVIKPVSWWKRYGLRLAMAAVGVALIVMIGLLLARRLWQAAPPADVQVEALVRWQAETSLPEGRSGMAAVLYEGQVYLAGGVTSLGVSPALLRYSIDSGRWEGRSDLPVAVRNVQAAVLGEKIYLPGGCRGDGSATDQLQVYDPRLDRWDMAAPLPEALCGYALAALEGKLYLFGGWDGRQVTDSVFSYEPSSDAWLKSGAMPAPAAYAAVLAADGKLYVIGGFNGKKALTANRIYFPNRDQTGEQSWEAGAALPNGRYAMGAASLAGTLYLVGGKDQVGDSLTPLQYLPGVGQWLVFEAPPEAAGAFPVLLPVETRLHLLGGEVAAGPRAGHQSYQAIYTILIPVVR
jgi:DNA-binding CsgD family transcriptional regulator/N-acetylneuraminic acid mutarotase